LRISSSAREAIVRHAAAARPRECCGVLLGRGDDIIEAVAARNLADDPNRFLVDPKAHIDARRDGRARGLEVVGFYHSHPHSGALPSVTDLAEAAYPELLYLIVSVDREPAEVRAFRLGRGNFDEIPLVTEG
jgi:proteasome lid subunit RPN8/RPN11